MIKLKEGLKRVAGQWHHEVVLHFHFQILQQRDAFDVRTKQVLVSASKLGLPRMLSGQIFLGENSLLLVFLF